MEDVNMAKKKNDTPFHISHNYKIHQIPELAQYGEYAGNMFWARDESDAVLYLKKIKERKNIN